MSNYKKPSINEVYVICYNKDCEVKKECGHYCSRHPKKDGGYVRYLGSGSKTCRNYDPIKETTDAKDTE